jgi:hypothetical protein
VLRNGAPDSVRCTRTVQLKPATLGFPQARSTIIHRTVRWVSGQRLSARNGRLWCVNSARTVRARSQIRSQRRTGRCTMWHRTVRCHKKTMAPTVDCSQTLTVGWCGGAPDSLQCMFGGAPDWPVRPSPAAFPNGLLVVEGYKYPQPPQLQASKSSEFFIQYKS